MPSPRPALLALLVMPSGGARRGARQALEAAGFQVRSAPEPYAATLEFAERRADLVVLDLGGWRRRDGAFLTAVRRLSPTTRILLLLPEGQRRAALQALRRGADAYVLEPFEADELGAVARGLLRERLSPDPADPEALGRLAAEVAHAINNPLQVLQLAAEAAAPRGGPAEAQREPLGRIRDVVALLAAFGRLSPPVRREVDLGSLLVAAVSAASTAGLVRLVGTPPAAGVVAEADGAQLEQALACCLGWLSAQAPRPPAEVSVRLRPPRREGGPRALQLLGRGLPAPEGGLSAALHTVLTSHEQTRRPRPGLALAASVLRLHGGRLRAAARPAGLLLTLTLPG